MWLVLKVVILSIKRYFDLCKAIMQLTGTQSRSMSETLCTVCYHTHGSGEMGYKISALMSKALAPNLWLLGIYHRWSTRLKSAKSQREKKDYL